MDGCLGVTVPSGRPLGVVPTGRLAFDGKAPLGKGGVALGDGLSRWPFLGSEVR